jgi:DNA-binding MarR family transcriptional regulator
MITKAERQTMRTMPPLEDIALDREDALRADFGWALGAIYRAYRKQADAVIGDVPGGPRGYHVLTAAARPAPLSQAAIAHEIGLDRTVMTYLVDELERAGLLRRQPDPHDRRARLLALTPDGARCVADVERRLAVVEERLLHGLDGPEQEVLRCLLQRVARQTDAIEPNGDRCAVMAAIDRGAPE